MRVRSRQADFKITEIRKECGHIPAAHSGVRGLAEVPTQLWAQAQQDQERDAEGGQGRVRLQWLCMRMSASLLPPL